mmetsp:Transcript_4310/g.13188  ORF Transcript_4310/g.13188 Transcript_4310/m.13188 type:complete len:709 (+) Transcript_4310:126-2252(+)
MGRCVAAWVAASMACVCEGLYVGVGKADATGPMTGVQFIGMAKSSQIGSGLHTRLYARAFVFVDEAGSRVAFVSLDSGMVGHVLKKRALEAAELSEYYNASNTIVSGTHTHSGPSGFLQHTLFQLAGSGWVPQTMDAMASGIARALSAAHADVEAQRSAGARQRVAVGATRLYNASLNRSPSGYAANPAEEKAAYDGDVDTEFTALGVWDSEEALRGVVTWFAVHPTSMNNTNTLVCADNKGQASLLVERERGAVAAFASSNLGDVTPNILGPHCLDSGEACDYDTSTCPEEFPLRGEVQRNEPCAAVGPGGDMFESTEIIAERQKAALDAVLAAPMSSLAADATVEVRHSYVAMPRLEVRDWETGDYVGTLCDAALGQAFAAGSVDGSGAFDFAQNATSTNPLWRIATAFLGADNPDLVACQAPKPVLLPTGNMTTPHPWSPSVVPVQLAKIGDLVIAAVPTEMTTMAGRRLKRLLKAKFGQNVTAVVAGLSNEYADYTTTYEEYQVQRYEAGSTIYGPHQLNAYLQEYAKLADAMLAGEASPHGPEPEDFSDQLTERLTRRLERLRLETPPDGADFGDVLSESWTSDQPLAPGDAAVVVFVGADMTNDLKTESTFVQVQFLDDDDDQASWQTLYVDADIETRIDCANKHTYREVSVRFDVPDDAASGSYRVLYSGDYRSSRARGRVSLAAFNGTSSTFQVAASAAA